MLERPGALHSPARERIHDSFAIALAKGPVERVAVILGQVVAHERLTTILVHSLKDLSLRVSLLSPRGRAWTAHLVSSSISEAGEEGDCSSAKGRICLVLEDDAVEMRHAIDLGAPSAQLFLACLLT